MIYFKIALLFCAVALILALVVNAVFFLSARLVGGAAISASRVGWIMLLGGWWIISFGVALRIAAVLKVFPFAWSK